MAKKLKISISCLCDFIAKIFTGAIRYRQMENGVANNNNSHTCTLNFVNFGPQMPKNRTVVLTNSWSIIAAIISPV